MNIFEANLVVAKIESVQGEGNFFTALLPLLIIFFIFYFLLIRPQSKSVKQHREFLKGLKKGDMVYTTGGIIGRVVDVHEKSATLEIAKDTRIKVIKTSIQGSYAEKTKEEEKKK